MTFSIGQYQLDNPVALAPMAGVTDLPFRKLCRTFGAGYVVGEMLASDPGLRRSRKSRLRGVHLNEPIPRAIQIVGWDPVTMAEAAKYNVDQGASIIDINMGCPAKKVCQRYAGSALLDQEDQVAKILDAVVSAVDVPVTLKIRTGVSVGKRNGVKIAMIAEEAGIQALAVHGRTRECKYNGHAEYTTINKICSAVSIPVFANGDITSSQQALEVLQQTNANGVMIGRGAHGSPWFPGQVAEFIQSGQIKPSPNIEQQMELIAGHLEEMYGFYGALQGVRIARKHIKWYVEKLPDRGAIDPKLFRSETPEAQLKQVLEFYQRYSHLTDTKTSHCPKKLFHSTMTAKKAETIIQGRIKVQDQLVPTVKTVNLVRAEQSNDLAQSQNACVRL